MDFKYREDMPEELLERLGKVYNHYKDYASEVIPPKEEVIVEETIIPEEENNTDDKIKKLEELNEKILNIINSPEWKKYIKGEE